VWISLDRLNNLEEKQCYFLNQVLDIYRQISAKTFLKIVCPLSSIQQPLILYQMDSKMEQIQLPTIQSELDIPILMKMLATPRQDGKQRVASMFFREDELARKLLAAIKKVIKQNKQK
jgi:hypothetical protein